jgi:hypothetical protein
MNSVPSDPAKCPVNVLCVDLGSTRTKAAVLRKGMSLKELHSVDVMILDSAPLWKLDFPCQFDRLKPGVQLLK